MKTAIMQPYFLPYLGYFQLMAAVDQFVVLDDVNFIKGGWLNRNRILSFGKVQWLTLPLSSASSNRNICEIQLQLNEKFLKKTFRVIEGAYQKAPNFVEGMELFHKLFEKPNSNLADFARESLLMVADYLSLDCKITPRSSIFENQHLTGQDRVLDICGQLSTTTYINLPGGKEIYSSDRFSKQGIKLAYIVPQLPSYGANFETGLSILDVIMNNSREDCQKLARLVVTD